MVARVVAAVVAHRGAAARAPSRVIGAHPTLAGTALLLVAAAKTELPRTVQALEPAARFAVADGARVESRGMLVSVACLAFNTHAPNAGFAYKRPARTFHAVTDASHIPFMKTVHRLREVRTVRILVGEKSVQHMRKAVLHRVRPRAGAFWGRRQLRRLRQVRVQGLQRAVCVMPQAAVQELLDPAAGLQVQTVFPKTRIRPGRRQCRLIRAADVPAFGACRSP